MPCVRRIPQSLIAVAAILTACTASPSLASGQVTARAANSATALSLSGTQRLLAARRAVEQAQQEHPESRLPAVRLPLDTLALARALAARPPLVEALRQQGFSPRSYAHGFAQLTTAVFGVAAVDTANKMKSPVGPNLMVRIQSRDSATRQTADGSEWLWIRERDAAFVRQHKQVLDTAGFSVSALGLTDQLPAEVQSFPRPDADGEVLDSTDPTGRAVTARPLRVLFLSDGGGPGTGAGVQHNEVYRAFQRIAAEGLRRRVVVGQITFGVARLKSLWEHPITRPVIRHLHWDYVVLQEHASAATPEEIAIGPSLYAKEVKAAGAKMVYTIFGRSTSSPPSFDRKEAALLAAARPVNPILAPMTAAWRAALAADPTIGLKSDYIGGGHLNAYGHYLQALVFYRAMTGRSPVGLPVVPIDDMQSKAFVIPSRDATILQHAAEAAFRPTANRHTTSPVDSLADGLPTTSVTRLYGISRALDSLQKIQPGEALPSLRLPIDSRVLERVLAANQRLVGLLQAQRMSLCTYADELTRLATALAAITAIDTLDKLQPQRWPVDWSIEIRVRSATKSTAVQFSPWLRVPAHDVALVVQYREPLERMGISASAFGLTDQLRTAKTRVIKPLDVSRAAPSRVATCAGPASSP